MFNYKSLEVPYGKIYNVDSLLIQDKELFGDEENHELTFYIFDGFAFCPDYNGKSYKIDFPLVSYFKTHKSDAQEIMDYANVDNVDDITPFDIIIFYGYVICVGDSDEDDRGVNHRERFENELEEKAAQTSSK